MGAIAEAFAAFAQPLLEQTDGSQEQMERAFSISQLCFNLAILPEESRERLISDTKLSLQMDDEEFADFRTSVLLPMIWRHQEMFPHMHIRGSTGFSLGGLLQRAPRANREIDRYAPCPCNSGRKYKFCCGKKGP